MITRLILVRHGNTFRENEVPRRVGRRTDLPLVETARAEKAARFIQESGLMPGSVFAAPLRRTMETAEIIVRALGLSAMPIVPMDAFSEIDYGEDEDKTEDEVIARLGRDALAAWDAAATVPPGWNVDVDAIIHNWKNFAARIDAGGTSLVVSSNGILRFAPHILAVGYDRFRAEHKIKVSTGGVCVFENGGGGWRCAAWNSKPV